MPVTVVPTSLATVAIDTFMTELSSVIRNWPVASVRSTTEAPLARAAGAAPTAVTRGRQLHAWTPPTPWRNPPCGFRTGHHPYRMTPVLPPRPRIVHSG